MHRDAIEITKTRIRLYTQFVNKQAENKYSKIYKDMAWLLYWVGIEQLLTPPTKEE